VIEFGYNPPAGLRGIEQFDTRTFVPDLQAVLDVAAPHFDSLWVADHLMTEQRFRMEAWTQLSWLAARFPDTQLGTLVLANSFRHPPLMAKMAASLQTFSRRRFILGYGAGWMPAEYQAYGFDFPPAPVRIEQMVEGIQVVRALWTTAPATYSGRYYQVQDAYCEPRPQPAPIVMVGGSGERYLLRAVAEHADWWNTLIYPIPDLRRKASVLDAYCRDLGRSPETVRRTLSRVVFLASGRAEAVERAGPHLDPPQPAFAGEPAELIDHIRELADLGFDLFQLIFAGFPDTTDLRLFVDKVLPAFR
jgi:alkanesulfonate monooxygenase SsuD/methylene tetrahydromethanopterin reductase-like flavin-dependent oxidoreductase (luciferase family)